MKRTLILLAVAILLVNSVGCCRGLRDWCYQGAYCGLPAPARPPMFAAAPSPAVPVFQHCVSQPACAPQPVAMPQPQYAVAAPNSMVYGNTGYGVPYMTEMGCGMPYMTEMGCNFNNDGTMILPSPEPYYSGSAP